MVDVSAYRGRFELLKQIRDSHLEEIDDINRRDVSDLHRGWAEAMDEAIVLIERHGK